MRQLEILAGRHLELNQADVVMAGDNTRPGTGSQHALNARGTLIRGVATAQLQVDIAAGNRLQRTGVQHRRARRASSLASSRRSSGSRQASFTLRGSAL
jgi:hypothetical protein